MDILDDNNLVPRCSASTRWQLHNGRLANPLPLTLTLQLRPQHRAICRADQLTAACLALAALDKALRAGAFPVHGLSFLLECGDRGGIWTSPGGKKTDPGEFHWSQSFPYCFEHRGSESVFL